MLHYNFLIEKYKFFQELLQVVKHFYIFKVSSRLLKFVYIFALHDISVSASQQCFIFFFYHIQSLSILGYVLMYARFVEKFSTVRN